MVDVHDAVTRRKNMSAIRNQNTKPEQLVARLLQAMNIDFATQEKQLPGKPDMYVAKYQCAIFVHGCYWHGHDCHLFKVPQTRTEFWLEKIASNRRRDQKVRKELQQQNTRQLIIWECSLKGSQKLAQEQLSVRIEEFLLSGQFFAEIGAKGFLTSKCENLKQDPLG